MTILLILYQKQSKNIFNPHLSQASPCCHNKEELKLIISDIKTALNQLISLLESLRKLYIITLYHNFILLFLNLGCVVYFTQSFFITFFKVSQQLNVANPRSRANVFMFLPIISSKPYFQNARSWYQIILNLRQICQSRNLRFRNQKGKQLKRKIGKYPRTKKGSLQGYSLRPVSLANTHLQVLIMRRGMLRVNKLITLLIVSVPVMKSPPPKNSKTLISQSELKLRQSKCLSSSSITQKKFYLKNQYLENQQGQIFNLELIISVSLSMRNLWLSNWICSHVSVRLSQAVSKRQNEGTALGYSHRMMGKDSSAKGTTRMTEQGMNLIISILIR